ncbi:MAG: hypothetical protein COW89_01110 [Nitrospinae bacterium CG22_combo_CG10-13_8_21_14_all_47_10]|nr:MAG: hypothetical protein COW89_01110 [Nitrospinae bacterium CG22_combo_CG10-13_8_21_14_all_47_10]PIQ43615.1 MAG: hypothetical protein COW05_03700 [Gammaproteobacteria bacterium CG12_big_fil_rev_8_21_14_0_65_46_12]PIR10875.1 MAG: hypothetical protein COV52_06765 [Gammaproteobacteria bacterium CG11_big_fil_rev_8_21_14_0_20_46_22]
MRSLPKFAFIIPACVALAACSSIAKEQTKFQTKTLADGSTLHYNVNVAPTKAWGCRRVGKTLTDSWGAVQTKAQFHFGGPVEYMAGEGVDYLNKNPVHANYMNINLPADVSVADVEVTAFKKAHVYFYQCKKINPENRLGRQSGVEIS